MSNASKRSGSPARRERAIRSAPAAARVPPVPRAILWASNSPSTESGYGQQTAQAVRRLKADGHAVAIASNYGIEGTTSSWEGMPHLPRGYDLHSNDVVPAYLQWWAHENKDLAPLLITLYDTWIFKGSNWDTAPRIASWTPVDHFPAPPDVVQWCKRDNVTPIAMSRFGEEMLKDAGCTDVLYVPHAIDTKVFTPTETFPARDGVMTGREFMGVDDSGGRKFVVGMVSANKGQVPNRKAFPESFLAFGMFARQHPEALLYVHTEAHGAMGGIDLPALAKACGIDDKQIVFADPFVWRMGVPATVLAACYTGMDVLLQPSMGEGFGIPLVEAQACGTPAITSSATASPELLGDGWTVEGQPWWDHVQKSWLMTPHVSSILARIVDAYERPRERSQKAIDFAAAYDADLVFDAYWRPALEALA